MRCCCGMLLLWCIRCYCLANAVVDVSLLLWRCYFAAVNMHPPTGFLLPSALASICLLVAHCKTIPVLLSSRVITGTSRTHRHICPSKGVSCHQRATANYPVLVWVLNLRYWPQGERLIVVQGLWRAPDKAGALWHTEHLRGMFPEASVGLILVKAPLNLGRSRQ